MSQKIYNVCVLLLIFTFSFRMETANAYSSESLPANFNYNSFLKWIKAHNYENVPDTFGFSAGPTSQYPSDVLAVSVVCRLKGGCENFALWPFDTSEVGIMYYNSSPDFSGGAKISSVSADGTQLLSNVIAKIYIPSLDKTFKPTASSAKPDIIGKNGIKDWAPFGHIDYNSTIMVIYFNVASLQSSNTRLAFEDVPPCPTVTCQNNENAKYLSSPAPLTRAPELINGTTWSLISREGVGPAYGNQPTELNYTYSVTNGVSSSKTFQLGLALGLEISGGFMSIGGKVSAGLSAVWGSSVQITSSATSSLSASCTNSSDTVSKICPTYELMATTSLRAPGIDALFADLNKPDSKTSDVLWVLGENKITDDGFAIGILYPVGGVFTSGLSITQRADYVVPLNSMQADHFFDDKSCEKSISNESKQPWSVSGEAASDLFGDPEYTFTNCAPFSPDGLCIILPQTKVTYSGRFFVHQGNLIVEDLKGQKESLHERGHYGFSICPFFDVDSDKTAVTLNSPEEGDLRILSDTW